MSTISASTTSTTAYKVTADTTGTLVLQTGSTPTTAVTIDTAQNVGLGVTPSAWSGQGGAVLELGNGAHLFGASASFVQLGANAYYNGSNYIYKGSSFASRYLQNNGQHIWYNAATGTAGNPITFTQAMTLNSSGSLSVGGTNADGTRGSFYGTTTALDSGGQLFVGVTDAIASDKGGQIMMGAYYTGTTMTSMGGIAAKRENGSSGNYAGYLQFITSTNGSGNTEKARIDSAGNLLVGTTSSEAKLTVAGNIRMPWGANRSLTIGTSSNWGYIFSGESNELYIRDLDANFNFLHASYNSGTKFIEFAGNTLRVYSGSAQVNGSLSKSSGSFRIDHPIPEMSDTHHLVHSFVEAPQADNIYRGKATLVGGAATVNIDEIAGMTDGTFVLLNREVQCFTTNETGWVHVRGSVTGNVLTIEAQDNTCTDTISWMVIGERQDKHMYDTEWTDDNGKVIVEPLKRVDVIDDTNPNEG